MLMRAGRAAWGVMATRFRVSHRTTYEYSQPMTDGYTLGVRHAPSDAVAERRSASRSWSNRSPTSVSSDATCSATVSCSSGSTISTIALAVTATSEVTVRADRTSVGDGPAWEDVAAAIVAQRGDDALDVRPFAGGVATRRRARRPRRRCAPSPQPAFAPRRPIVDATRALCHTIHEQFDYDRTFTEVSTPLAAVLQARRGVCQDFAHLAIAALRMFGLAGAT